MFNPAFFKAVISFVFLQSVFLLSGCDRPNPGLESTSYYQIEKATSEYLQTSVFINSFLGVDARINQTFCAYQVYGTEAKTRKFYQYMWMFCQEYERIDNQLKAKVSASFPVAFVLKKTKEGKYQVIEHKIPREGEEGKRDLKSFFPLYILNNVNFPLNNSDYNEYLISKLERNTLETAKFHFNIEE